MFFRLCAVFPLLVALGCDSGRAMEERNLRLGVDQFFTLDEKRKKVFQIDHVVEKHLLSPQQRDCKFVLELADLGQETVQAFVGQVIELRNQKFATVACLPRQDDNLSRKSKKREKAQLLRDFLGYVNKYGKVESEFLGGQGKSLLTVICTPPFDIQDYVQDGSGQFHQIVTKGSLGTLLGKSERLALCPGAIQGSYVTIYPVSRILFLDENLLRSLIGLSLCIDSLPSDAARSPFLERLGKPFGDLCTRNAIHELAKVFLELSGLLYNSAGINLEFLGYAVSPLVKILMPSAVDLKGIVRPLVSSFVLRKVPVDIQNEESAKKKRSKKMTVKTREKGKKTNPEESNAVNAATIFLKCLINRKPTLEEDPNPQSVSQIPSLQREKMWGSEGESAPGGSGAIHLSDVMSFLVEELSFGGKDKDLLEAASRIAALVDASINAFPSGEVSRLIETVKAPGASSDSQTAFALCGLMGQFGLPLSNSTTAVKFVRDIVSPLVGVLMGQEVEAISSFLQHVSSGGHFSSLSGIICEIAKRDTQKNLKESMRPFFSEIKNLSHLYTGDLSVSLVPSEEEGLQDEVPISLRGEKHGEQNDDDDYD